MTQSYDKSRTSSATFYEPRSLRPRIGTYTQQAPKPNPPTATTEVTTEVVFVTITQFPTDIPSTEIRTTTEIHTTDRISTTTESGITETVRETVETDYTSTTVVTNQKSEVPLPIGFTILGLFGIVLIYRKKYQQ